MAEHVEHVVTDQNGQTTTFILRQYLTCKTDWIFWTAILEFAHTEFAFTVVKTRYMRRIPAREAAILLQTWQTNTTPRKLETRGFVLRLAKERLQLHH